MCGFIYQLRLSGPQKKWPALRQATEFPERRGMGGGPNDGPDHIALVEMASRDRVRLR
jgi:hypothetical protein